MRFRCPHCFLFSGEKSRLLIFVQVGMRLLHVRPGLNDLQDPGRHKVCPH